MAIDNRLSLAAQPTNLQAAITGGLSLGENLRNSGVRDAVLRQQEQVGAQTIQQNKVVQQQQKSAFMNKLATGLKTVPIANRAAIISQQMGMMETMGFDRADILSQGLSDKDLDQVIAGTQASVAAPQKPTSGMQDFQFYQDIIENPKSTPDQIQAAQIQQGTQANVGRSQIKEVSPGVFQSYDPNTNVFGPVYRVEPDGTQVPLTREEQNKLASGELSNTAAAVGAAETVVDVNKARKLAEVALDAELKLSDMTDLSVRRKAYVTQGAAAKDSIPNIGRMIQINDRVMTGGATAFTKGITDFLGMTSADLGEFNRASGELVLSTIRALGANPTEGERAFLEKIQPSVGQSPEVNAVILKNLMAISERQVARARLLQSSKELDPNDMILSEPDFVQLYGPDVNPAEAAPAQNQVPVGSGNNNAVNNTDYVNGLFQ